MHVTKLWLLLNNATNSTYSLLRFIAEKYYVHSGVAWYGVCVNSNAATSYNSIVSPPVFPGEWNGRNSLQLSFHNYSVSAEWNKGLWMVITWWAISKKISCEARNNMFGAKYKEHNSKVPVLTKGNKRKFTILIFLRTRNNVLIVHYGCRNNHVSTFVQFIGQ